MSVSHKRALQKNQTNCCSSHLSQRQCMLDLQSVATVSLCCRQALDSPNLIGNNNPDFRLGYCSSGHNTPQSAAAEGALEPNPQPAAFRDRRMRPPLDSMTSREGCTHVCARAAKNTHCAACLAPHSMQPLRGCVLSSGAGEAALKLWRG